MKNLQHHSLTILIVASVASLSMLAGAFLFAESDAGRLGKFYDRASGLNFDYSSDIVVQSSSDTDAADNLIGSLGPIDVPDDRPFIITANQNSYNGRQEVLGASAVAGDEPSVTEQADEQASQHFPGMNMERFQRYVVDGVEYSDTLFTYDGLGGTTVRRRIVEFISPRDGSVISLSLVASANNFAEFNEKYFQEIIDTASIE